MSTILVDNLTGKTSAGDITVTSEGGAATQSLQQGLAKAWINFNGTGTIAARDSLNHSTLTDSGTGKYDIAFTSSMNNDDFSVSNSTGRSLTGYYSAGLTALSHLLTTGYSISTMTSTGGAEDHPQPMMQITGDLA